jgi:hypothetical protein
MVIDGGGRGCGEDEEEVELVGGCERRETLPSLVGCRSGVVKILVRGAGLVDAEPSVLAAIDQDSTESFKGRKRNLSSDNERRHPPESF